MKRTILLIIVPVVLFGITIALFKKPAEPVMAKANVTVHKTATCGCCGNYVGYLKQNGYNVTVINHATNELMTAEKRKMDIPSSLDSCHTTVFDESKLYVEGHIPIEAVDKVFADKPEIDGIGMPGMPSASPGMPGKKTEPFNISQVKRDGNVLPYMTL